MPKSKCAEPESGKVICELKNAREWIAVSSLNGILASLSHPVAQQLYQRRAEKEGVPVREVHVRCAFEYADLVLAKRKEKEVSRQ